MQKNNNKQTVSVEAYRRKVVVFFLSIWRKQIHTSYHWNWPLPPALNVTIHAAALGALPVLTWVITCAVFMQKCICCPFFSMLLDHFLRNGALRRNELPIVGNGSRSRPSAPSSGLDGGNFWWRRWGFILGWCGWLSETGRRDQRGATGCWRGVFCLEKNFFHLLIRRYLRSKGKSSKLHGDGHIDKLNDLQCTEHNACREGHLLLRNRAVWYCES